MDSLEGETVKITGNLWDAISLKHIMGPKFLPNAIVEVVKDTEDEVVFRPNDTELLPGDLEQVLINEHATELSNYSSARELFLDNVKVNF